MREEKIEKLNEAIKNELSKILAREIDLPIGTILTITAARTLEDLSESRIFVSVFPENKIEETLAVLNRQVVDLQNILNKKIRTRWMPKIKFFEDKELKEARKIDVLLEKIQKEEM